MDSPQGEIMTKNNNSKTIKIRILNPVMGVPVTFLDKFNPKQFEIIGCPDFTGQYGSDYVGITPIGKKWISDYKRQGGRGHYTENMTSLVFYGANGKAACTFKRILIRQHLQ